MTKSYCINSLFLIWMDFRVTLHIFTSIFAHHNFAIVSTFYGHYCGWDVGLVLFLVALVREKNELERYWRLNDLLVRSWPGMPDITLFSCCPVPKNAWIWISCLFMFFLCLLAKERWVKLLEYEWFFKKNNTTNVQLRLSDMLEYEWIAHVCQSP